ncbi:hypothetical protein R3P38DRAFT_3177921 [Favolaschia claudopus]|uniref:Uncharacterized protein n=1 Tax=Favolaschia claudopus TaxID=2862362 RepID=A0AAW0CXK2_9AGAR
MLVSTVEYTIRCIEKYESLYVDKFVGIEAIKEKDKQRNGAWECGLDALDDVISDEQWLLELFCTVLAVLLVILTKYIPFCRSPTSAEPPLLTPNVFAHTRQKAQLLLLIGAGYLPDAFQGEFDFVSLNPKLSAKKTLCNELKLAGLDLLVPVLEFTGSSSSVAMLHLGHQSSFFVFVRPPSQSIAQGLLCDDSPLALESETHALARRAAFPSTPQSRRHDVSSACPRPRRIASPQARHEVPLKTKMMYDKISFVIYTPRSDLFPVAGSIDVPTNSNAPSARARCRKIPLATFGHWLWYLGEDWEDSWWTVVGAELSEHRDRSLHPVFFSISVQCPRPGASPPNDNSFAMTAFAHPRPDVQHTHQRLISLRFVDDCSSHIQTDATF